MTTAAILNIHLRDNLSALQAQAAAVLTSESTSSVTFTDLATSGPAVTVNTGDQTSVLAFIGMQSNHDTAGVTFMGVAVSGATTRAANDTDAYSWNSVANNQDQSAVRIIHITGLTAGSNTFTAKYRVTTGSGDFDNRVLAVFI